jgi:hypothetical protein
MPATSSTTQTPERGARPTAAAVGETTGSAAERGASLEAAAAEAGSDIDMLTTLSRMVYSGAYALAYGAVYATVFVAQSLPQENSVMHGFRDGGRAAMDELSRSS